MSRQAFYSVALGLTVAFVVAWCFVAYQVLTQQAMMMRWDGPSRPPGRITGREYTEAPVDSTAMRPESAPRDKPPPTVSPSDP